MRVLKLLLTLGLIVSGLNSGAQNWTIYDTDNSDIPSDIISSAVVDGQIMWVGTGSGVGRFENNTWTTYNDTNSGLISNQVTSLVVDGSGKLWVGTIAGISVYDGSSWTSYHSGNSGLPVNYIKHIGLDDQDNKWISTPNGGLIRYDGQNWTVFDDANSPIGSDLIHSTTFYNGTLYIGTAGNGLVTFDGQNWNEYNTTNSDIASDLIAVINVVNDTIWLGNSSLGLNRLVGGNWDLYDTFTGLTAGSIKSLYYNPIKHDLWIGTIQGGLNIMHNGIVIHKLDANNSQLPQDNVNVITKGVAPNSVIIGTSMGLAIYSGPLLGVGTGGNENPAVSNIQIHPNPTSGSIMASISLTDHRAVKCTVFNLLGEVVYREDLERLTVGMNQITLDLPDLLSGLYILEANGVQQKFVVR